ncbi:MAG: hypothetical protein MZW92_31410 [Comamonadaceae bacterium]|nr:hypothetical protein [Comamonadaceae bacterium]
MGLVEFSAKVQPVTDGIEPVFELPGKTYMYEWSKDEAGNITYGEQGERLKIRGVALNNIEGVYCAADLQVSATGQQESHHVPGNKLTSGEYAVLNSGTELELNIGSRFNSNTDHISPYIVELATGSSFNTDAGNTSKFFSFVYVQPKLHVLGTPTGEGFIANTTPLTHFKYAYDPDRPEEDRWQRCKEPVGWLATNLPYDVWLAYPLDTAPESEYYVVQEFRRATFDCKTIQYQNLSGGSIHTFTAPLGCCIGVWDGKDFVPTQMAEIVAGREIGPGLVVLSTSSAPNTACTAITFVDDVPFPGVMVGTNDLEEEGVLVYHTAATPAGVYGTVSAASSTDSTGTSFVMPIVEGLV